MRSLESDTPVWLSSSFLALTLNTFSDGITILENNKIIGYFASRQLLEFIIKNPTSLALKEKTVKDLPKRDRFVVFSSRNTLRDILNEWKKSRFAYSAIQDGDKFSSISINSMLGLVDLYDLPNTISEIPKKPTITYSNDDTVIAVLDKMFHHKVRRLVLENTADVLSDRIIVGAICDEFDFLRKTPNFLSVKAKSFNPKTAREIHPDSKITDVAHNMLNENHYAAISNGQIISPWDIITKFFEVMDGK
ncbi:CBS domain-containing protein [Candidatus Nitrosopumilus salarius]|nr:hypothetical protein [Candidatus Nitrosopumilus salaria]